MTNLEGLRQRGLAGSAGVRSYDTAAIDAGNKPNDHYQSKLSPLRYKLRELCLPIIRKETEVLAKLQESLRTPFLDLYFAWTANLASHTFYVLMLPLPIWLGSSRLIRDLIYVLGYGIYFSGYLKDYLCLPRPRSPPLHRITMSSYTAQEYGFPSSHAANATAVTLIMLAKTIEYKLDFSPINFTLIIIFLVLYYFSLIFGRIYCGMHGVFDILSGSIIGAALFLFRFYLGEKFDNLLLFNNYNIFIVIFFIIGFNLSLIHIHAEPVDDCPCFDDSVAFIGVIIGIDLSHLALIRSEYLLIKNPFFDHLYVNYDYNLVGGIFGTLLRIIIGIILVVIWKAISKPLIFTILPPIYKIIGLNLPRKNYQATAFTKTTNRQIRSTSISNINNTNIANFEGFIKGVADHSKSDKVGPENEIDYYALLDYQQQEENRAKLDQKQDENKAKLDQKQEKNAKLTSPPVGVFKPRYDVEIIGRIIVYAGVSTVAVWGFIYATEFLNLDIKFDL